MSKKEKSFEDKLQKNSEDKITEDAISDSDYNESTEPEVVVEEGNCEEKQEPDDAGKDEESEANAADDESAVNGDISKTSQEEELNNRYLRLAADFQNYKKRAEKEKNDIYAYANEKLIVELLSVIDNFDRALAVESTDQGMQEGMKMILKQFKGVLENSGLEEIPAEGENFDPNFHHAVLMESVENYTSGQITQVLQKGYMLNKKVIRPSMVKVAE